MSLGRLTATLVGDSAIELAVPTAAAADTVAHVRAVADAVAATDCPEIVDVVPGIDRVLVVYDPVRNGDPHALRDRLAAMATTEIRQGHRGTRHEIPVCYGGSHGPDLEEVCRLHRLDRADLVRLHTGPEYLVQTVGFTPGFGYLHGLPQSLATPRRRTPRTHVPAGSVGIGGSQTGVYPFPTPGGWSIIGCSPTVFFDVSQPHPALLRTGDTLRFVEITAVEFAAASAGRVATMTTHVTMPAATPGILVEEPGLWTTIQDLGRPGQRAAGVPQSGGVDAASLRLANLLVGNPETAAGLEFTLTGPRLLFERDTLVAVAGGDFTGLPRWQPVRIQAGTHVALGQARSGCRGVLAVAGGIAVPRVLGSASTYEPAALGGLGGRRLAAGDRLPLGDACLPSITPADIDPRLISSIVPDPPQPCTLRIIPAVADGLPPHERLWHQAWRASARSNRMGVRLEGDPLETTATTTGDHSISKPVLPGTVQLPPDGQPIVLLADAQTMGGYPVIGHVIAADLRLAAQLRPGHPVRWQAVTLDEARAAALAAESMLASLRRSGAPSGRDGT